MVCVFLGGASLTAVQGHQWSRFKVEYPGTGPTPTPLPDGFVVGCGEGPLTGPGSHMPQTWWLLTVGYIFSGIYQMVLDRPGYWSRG